MHSKLGCSVHIAEDRRAAMNATEYRQRQQHKKRTVTNGQNLVR